MPDFNVNGMNLNSGSGEGEGERERGLIGVGGVGGERSTTPTHQNGVGLENLEDTVSLERADSGTSQASQLSHTY